MSQGPLPCDSQRALGAVEHTHAPLSPAIASGQVH